MASYDYIIIGAGSAGCVLAERLSASGRHSVLVLEAGGRDRSPWVRLPLGYGKTFFHPEMNWRYQSEADPGLGGRSDYWPRGRVVGGSSSINALVWARGLPHDFDDWAAAGATGWSWEVARRTYDAMETRVSADGGREGQGPLHVQDVSDQIHKVNRHFFAGAEEAGLPRTEDCNGATPEGATTYRITTRDGLRHSAARAYLAPALKRANVTLRTGVTVTRIGFEGRRARSVHLRHHGHEEVLQAGREIILSAGAVSSPRLLQLSGVGPAQLLREHGIEVRADAPHVGGNLQDHLGLNYYFKANEPTLNDQLRPLWGKALAALRYALTRRGPLALSVNQCGGLFRSTPEAPVPDQQIYFNPVSYTTTPSGTRNVVNPDPFPGFIIGYQPTRPTSRGRIDISSADPEAAPRIRPNSLATEEDRAAVIAGGTLCRRIMQTPALEGLIDSALDPDLRELQGEQILEDFRRRCGTVFHPVGTCRMGADPASSVVDPRLRLHGFEGLRVVDASIFPNITSGNTNAPTMMAAHHAAELILEAT
ncbi:GMC family oxidoreductase N-terminal domain-containing protein [Roseivivax sp. GX 12232]|uniref:GMC family oxidoreductase n=1 Tax=Roseivivax sp. GX 12232 TaxID=2900547 RepID=UPI001E4C2738|nr:GMC family oxidoreductase N-terminal domain-containing protein [Roseivivax sp. GX 12232]MCE0506600.1 GMC family oxidoreductase N-terminal domain-containing protein [Roseivivax sp. GX 12232]